MIHFTGVEDDRQQFVIEPTVLFGPLGGSDKVHLQIVFDTTYIGIMHDYWCQYSSVSMIQVEILTSTFEKYTK